MVDDRIDFGLDEKHKTNHHEPQQMTFHPKSSQTVTLALKYLGFCASLFFIHSEIKTLGP